MPLTEIPAESCSPDEIIRVAEKIWQSYGRLSLKPIYYARETLEIALQKILGNPLNSLPQLKDQSLNSLQLNSALILALLTLDPKKHVLCVLLIKQGADPVCLSILNTPVPFKNAMFVYAFSENMPNIVISLARFVDINTFKTSEWLVTTPLQKASFLSEAIVKGNYPLAKALLAAGIDPSIPDSTGFQVTHHLQRISPNLPIPEIEKLIELIVEPGPYQHQKGLALNTVILACTPLQIAANCLNKNVIQALFLASKKLKKPLFPDNDKSLWHCTVSSEMKGATGEDIALAIIDYAEKLNGKLPKEHQKDVLATHPASGLYAEEKPSKFLNLAIQKGWTRVTELSIKKHPEWCREASNEPALHDALKEFSDGKNEAASLRNIFRLAQHGSDLDRRIWNFNFGLVNALERMTDIPVEKIKHHLAFVPCELLANLARGRDLKNTAATRLVAHTTGKKSRINPEEETLSWLTTSNQTKLLLTKHHQNRLFGTLSKMTASVDAYSYLICDCLVKFISLRSRNNYWMIPMIFSFLDLSELVYLIQKEKNELKEWKSAPIDHDIKGDFSKYYIPSLVIKAHNAYIDRSRVPTQNEVLLLDNTRLQRFLSFAFAHTNRDKARLAIWTLETKYNDINASVTLIYQTSVGESTTTVKSESKSSALCIAAAHGRLETVRDLIRAEAKVDPVTEKMALIELKLFTAPEDCLLFFKPKNPSPYPPPTPLCAAVAGLHVDIVNELLSHFHHELDVTQAFYSLCLSYNQGMLDGFNPSIVNAGFATQCHTRCMIAESLLKAGANMHCVAPLKNSMDQILDFHHVFFEAIAHADSIMVSFILKNIKDFSFLEAIARVSYCDKQLGMIALMVNSGKNKEIFNIAIMLAENIAHHPTATDKTKEKLLSTILRDFFTNYCKLEKDLHSKIALLVLEYFLQQGATLDRLLQDSSLESLFNQLNKAKSDLGKEEFIKPAETIFKHLDKCYFSLIDATLAHLATYPEPTSPAFVTQSKNGLDQIAIFKEQLLKLTSEETKLPGHFWEKKGSDLYILINNFRNSIQNNPTINEKFCQFLGISPEGLFFEFFDFYRVAGKCYKETLAKKSSPHAVVL